MLTEDNLIELEEFRKNRFIAFAGMYDYTARGSDQIIGRYASIADAKFDIDIHSYEWVEVFDSLLESVTLIKW